MSEKPVTLDQASIEAIAQRVAELLSPASRGGALVSAAEIAKRLGVSREYVYEHAKELGGEKIGSGPKAPWRFDPAKVAALSDALRPQPPAQRRPRQTVRRTGTTKLLEIRGEKTPGF